MKRISLIAAQAIYGVLLFSWCEGACGDTPQGPGSDELAAYGAVTNVSVISNGFVFIGNEYVDAPYEVTQKGLGIFINGHQVGRVSVLPPSPRVDKEPMLPQGITTNTLFISDAVFEYVHQVGYYCDQHFDSEQSIEKTVELYRRLPCVRSIDYDSGSRKMIVYSFSGETNTRVVLSSARSALREKNDVMRELDTTRNYYQRALQEGRAIFLVKQGGSWQELPASVAKRHLPAILLLRNKNIKNAPAQEQASKQSEALAHAGLRLNPGLLPDLLTNFTASSQLDERIEKMLKQGGQE